LSNPQIIKALDVVLPCYNPITKQWANEVIEEFKHLENAVSPTKLNLIIVNDGSTTLLAEGFDAIKAEINNFELVDYTENRGKGHALREGFKASKAGFVIYTDIDFPYTSQSFKNIFNSLNKGNVLAVGYRDNDYYKDIPWFRKWLSKFLRKLIQTMLNTDVTDSQCGIKGFNAKGKDIFLQTTIDRYLFDLELIKIASKKVTIAKVPVELKPNVVFTSMSLKVLLQESTNFFKILLR